MNFNPYYYQPQQQPQNGSLVTVRGMQEAMNYPVALGSSVTFKDETAPYIYTKTMGFSQLDRPSFEVFKLVKENMSTESIQNTTRDLGKEFDALKIEVERLRSMIDPEVEADG